MGTRALAGNGNARAAALMLLGLFRRHPLACAAWLGMRGDSGARRASFPALLGGGLAAAFAAFLSWRWMQDAGTTPLALLSAHATLTLALPAAWSGMLGVRERQRFQRERADSWLASLPIAPALLARVAMLRAATVIAQRALLLGLVLVATSLAFSAGMDGGERHVFVLLAAGFALGGVLGWLSGARKSPPARRLRYANRSAPATPVASLSALGRWPGLELRARGNARGMARTLAVVLMILPMGVPPLIAVMSLAVGVIAFLLADARRGVLDSLADARTWLAPTPLGAARLARALLPRALAWQVGGTALEIFLLGLLGADAGRTITVGVIWLLVWSATCFHACVGRQSRIATRTPA